MDEYTIDYMVGMYNTAETHVRDAILREFAKRAVIGRSTATKLRRMGFAPDADKIMLAVARCERLLSFYNSAA